MEHDPICGMKVNELTCLKLVVNDRLYYFCSARCLERFAAENNIPQEAVSIALCRTQPGKPFYRNKTFIVFSILAGIVLLSYFFVLFEPFRQSLSMYARKIWWAVLAGLLLGGVIDNYVPREYITSFLARPHKRTIFYSVLLGFFMSFCSHGILALSIQLYKKGASSSSIVAFLLASPWANMTVTIMMFGFFGLKAIYLLLSAIFVAITTGLVFQILERKQLIEINKNTLALDKNFSIISDIKIRFKNYKFTAQTLKSDTKGVWQGTKSLGDMVLWWIMIGVGIASTAGAYIPSQYFSHYMGPNIFGLLVTLFFATIIEVCSEGSSPIAFEIYNQTGALGNSLVFLMAGVATDYTEIGLLWQNVGRKTAIWLPIVTVPQVLILGYIANLLL